MKNEVRYILRSSMAFVIAIAVAGVSYALPVGKTIRYDHIYEGEPGAEDGLQETFYLRIDEFGTASATSTDGLTVSLTIDDSGGYDLYSIDVGGTSFQTPWDGVGELATIEYGDGRIVRLKEDGGYARGEREITYDHLQNLIEFSIGGAMWIFMMYGVRRHGWWF